MYSLPTTIKIRDSEFNIRNKGDYRVVLDCFNALQDEELSEEERVISSLVIFYDDIHCFDDIVTLFPDEDTMKEAITGMYNFFNCGRSTIGATQQYKLIDWTQDELLVCAGVNNVANTEIRALPYLHWWTFMGYYMSVGDSVLATVVGIRHKIMAHKKLEKWEKEYKRDNPGYFVWKSTTLKDREQENLIRELWNNGGK